MSPAIWLCCFLPLLIILLQQSEKTKAAVLRKIIKKRKGGEKAMIEMLEKYIGKECLIYTVSSSTQVAGTIISVKDNWVEIDNKGTVESVNADYIIRVREYPKTKKGKNKSVVLD